MVRCDKVSRELCPGYSVIISAFFISFSFRAKKHQPSLHVNGRDWKQAGVKKQTQRVLVLVVLHPFERKTEVISSDRVGCLCPCALRFPKVLIIFVTVYRGNSWLFLDPFSLVSQHLIMIGFLSQSYYTTSLCLTCKLIDIYACSTTTRFKWISNRVMLTCLAYPLYRVYIYLWPPGYVYIHFSSSYTKCAPSLLGLYIHKGYITQVRSCSLLQFSLIYLWCTKMLAFKYGVLLQM
jgi:hypothetical protein